MEQEERGGVAGGAWGAARPSPPADVRLPPSEGQCEMFRWRVRVGAPVQCGQVVAECRRPAGAAPPVTVRVRTHLPGNVARLCAKEGERLEPGQILLEIEECTHPTVMKDMCADCGTDLRRDDNPQINVASIPMVHSIPELKVSEQLAKELGKKDSERLLKDRKLVLLVDLDQTLIHTTNDFIPPNLKVPDVHHFQLRSWSPGGGGRWYHTRLRPGTLKFLKTISATYELHICTFGARAYAHKVAELLDPHGVLFSHRILSRDECFNIHTKTPNLRALFPCGDNLVCIIDDREDVWNRASNLIQVKPYHFFEHTGDINAPPGLGKTERDIEGQGINLEDLPTKTDNNSEAKQDAKSENGQNMETEESQNVELENGKNFKSEENKDTKSEENKDTNSEENKDTNSEENKDANAEKNNDANSEEKKEIKSEENKDTNFKENKEIKSEEKQNMKSDENQSIKSEETQNMNTEELPLLDVENPETIPDSTQLEKTEDAVVPESNMVDDESNIKNDESVKNKDVEPMEVIESENTIVKDIEKIVSQVQENFIGADSTIDEKSEPDSSSKDTEPLDNSGKTNNVECDSTSTLNSDDKSQTQNIQTRYKMTSDGLIDVEDSDDYLLYLEEILQRIHKSFYDMYDTMEAGSVPDLKTVIPEVKNQVLAGTSLVFSGLVPTHQKLEHSRAYMVAQSLGAEVTQDFTDRTTHLVAVRPGTAKVHACRRVSTSTGKPTPHTVTPAWLWCCAERWQHVEEVLFPLRGGADRLPRRPPPHCGSPPRIPHHPTTTSRRRTPSGRFMDTINPLLSFSSDDIADMDKEVEDIINESDESESEDKVTSKNGNAGEDRLAENSTDVPSLSNNVCDDLANISSDSESIESLSGSEYPHGWKPSKTRKRRRSNSLLRNNDCTDPESPSKHSKRNLLLLEYTEDGTQEESTLEEYPSEKFKRGGELPSDAPDQNDSDTNGSVEAPDDIDDGEWNMMGAALEREFLGLDK